MLDLLPTALVSFFILQIRSKQNKTEQPRIIYHPLLEIFYLISYKYVRISLTQVNVSL